MSFIRALSSGVSGLRNHQLMMDVIGNNIANINTVGFKGSRAMFSELFAQTLRGATQPFGNNGGINPMQVGLGSRVGSIDKSFSQGNIESTGNTMDLAIQGQSFFVLQKDGQQYYSRVGTFQLDSGGTIVHPGSGAVLQGRMADTRGIIADGARVENIRIALDRNSPPQATTEARFAGNLNANAAVGAVVNGTVNVYDSLGNRHALTLSFQKLDDNQWQWEASIPDPDNPGSEIIVGGGPGNTVEFDGTGMITSINGVAVDENEPILLPISFTPTGGANLVELNINIGVGSQFTGITQNEGGSNIAPREQNGYGAGSLTDISIDEHGQILGTFSNGTVLTLAQIMVAEFNNPSALMIRGDNLYEISSNSGEPALVTPGSTASSILSGALEMSNVDLAQEFTRMIVAQRGFQSNARVISVSDDILSEVVNLKR
jgi:flagellar hook protein FlgE